MSWDYTQTVRDRVAQLGVLAEFLPGSAYLGRGEVLVNTKTEMAVRTTFMFRPVVGQVVAIAPVNEPMLGDKRDDVPSHTFRPQVREEIDAHWLALESLAMQPVTVKGVSTSPAPDQFGGCVLVVELECADGVARAMAFYGLFMVLRAVEVEEDSDERDAG